jgi:hypothetical protein
MPLDTSIALGVQAPQVKAVDPMAIYQMMQDRQANALRTQALQQDMAKNAMIMQNTEEDRRIAAATRAEAARRAAEERRLQVEFMRDVQSGFTPAKNAIMGPGTIQGSTPAQFDPTAVKNRLLARGNVGGLKTYSDMLEQFAKQQEAEGKATGQGLTNKKIEAETAGLNLKNVTDQLAQLNAGIERAAAPEEIDALFDGNAEAIRATGKTPEMSKATFRELAGRVGFDNAKMQVAQGIMATQKHLNDMLTGQAGRSEVTQDAAGNQIIIDKAANTAMPVTTPEGAPIKSVTKGGLTEAQRLREKRATGDDYNMATTALRDLQDVVRTADRLEKADLSSVTGYASKVPSFSAEATKAESDIDTLKGKMTALSKTLSSASGKLGNLAVAEYQMLRDQIAAFDPYKGEAATRQQLADIKSTMSRIENSVRDVYSRTYGGEDNPFTQFRELPKEVGANAKVSTGDAEIDSLLGKYGQ